MKDAELNFGQNPEDEDDDELDDDSGIYIPDKAQEMESSILVVVTECL